MGFPLSDVDFPQCETPRLGAVLPPMGFRHILISVTLCLFIPQRNKKRRIKNAPFQSYTIG
jgi:hypothetical protein